MTREETMDKIALLLRMMNPEFDWETHYYEDADAPSPEDVFREIFEHATFDAVNEIQAVTPRFYDAVSIKPSDTSKGLYRLLYLIQPPQVDFSSMYKGGLFCFWSHDREWLFSIELFKYELGIYVAGPKQYLTPRNVVTGGWPGCDNGSRITSDYGNALVDIVRKGVEYEWLVYSGNNFKV